MNSTMNANSNALLEDSLGRLLQASEGQLYEQLGIRAKALAHDPAIAGSFDPQVSYDGAQMGPLDDVREFGQRLFRRWNQEAYKLICGGDIDDADDRKKLLAAFGGGDVAVGAVLAGLFVQYLGMAPALAGVVAALVLKHFFRPAFGEFCGLWLEKLPK
jgi:hypothetical protein